MGCGIFSSDKAGYRLGKSLIFDIGIKRIRDIQAKIYRDVGYSGVRHPLPPSFGTSISWNLISIKPSN